MIVEAMAVVYLTKEIVALPFVQKIINGAAVGIASAVEAGRVAVEASEILKSEDRTEGQHGQVHP